MLTLRLGLRGDHEGTTRDLKRTQCSSVVSCHRSGGRLGMAVLGDDVPLLHQAIDEGLRLAPEHLEAARKLRHAYRLKQTACDPSELLKCKGLFQEAFAANADLRQPLSRIGAAEESYLPFWIL